MAFYTLASGSQSRFVHCAESFFLKNSFALGPALGLKSETRKLHSESVKELNVDTYSSNQRIIRNEAEASTLTEVRASTSLLASCFLLLFLFSRLSDLPFPLFFDSLIYFSHLYYETSFYSPSNTNPMVNSHRDFEGIISMEGRCGPLRILERPYESSKVYGIKVSPIKTLHRGNIADFELIWG